MAGLLDTSLSALNSYQRALGVTSHNIANSGTEGYSRQRVEFGSRAPTSLNRTAVGSGVAVEGIRRVYDDFIARQIRDSTSAHARYDTLETLTSTTTDRLANADTGIGAGLSRYFDSVQELSDDPASSTARSLFLSEARALSARFNDLDGQLQGLATEVNDRIKSGVSDVNEAIDRVFDLNQRIQSAASSGLSASELEDERDDALRILSQFTDVKVNENTDGSVSVYLGSGQPLVLQDQHFSLAATRNTFDNQRLEVSVVTSNGAARITDGIRGGSLGGAIEFRREMLDSSRAELGRIAVGLAETMNAQQRAGVDANGQPGAELFSLAAPQVSGSVNNAGSATLSVSRTGSDELQSPDLLLLYNGTDYEVLDRATRRNVNFSGSGSSGDPIAVAGLEFVISGTPASGDEFLVQPASGAAGQIGVILSDPSGIAAAAPTLASAVAGNTGNGVVSTGSVSDGSDPLLFAGGEIAFTGANTYTINGAGSFSYTSGDSITVSGMSVVLEGVPAAGDRFVLEPVGRNSGDNRNALQMADAELRGLFSGGTISLNEAVNGMNGNLAVSSRSASLSRESQQVLLTQTTGRRESVSGVNLDEEAADLLRYQQSYQAAAQAVSIANTLFDTLLGAVR